MKNKVLEIADFVGGQDQTIQAKMLRHSSYLTNAGRTVISIENKYPYFFLLNLIFVLARYYSFESLDYFLMSIQSVIMITYYGSELLVKYYAHESI